MARISVRWFWSTFGPEDESSEFSEEDESEVSKPLHYTYMCFAYLLLCISLFTLSYGVTSWILIRKFRNINNFVFLNTSLAIVVRLIVVSTTILHRGFEIFNEDYLSVIMLSYVTMVYKYCLVVICYMFYIDIVQVFYKDIKRKYLKVTLFTWVVPILLSSIFISVLALTMHVIEDPATEFIVSFITMIIAVACNALPAIVNSIIFIKIIWTLFFSKSDGAALSKTAKCKDKLQRLCLAIALFVLSNLIITTLASWEIFDVIFILEYVTSALQIVIISLIVPFSKNNRALWQEYMKTRILWTLS